MALTLLLLPLLQVALATLARRTDANDVITSYVSSTFDWDSRSSSASADCVNIPRNLTLCSNMDYHRMRLPNLLEHETLSEVSQQAASWVPLLNIRCHPDTQRFVCSLFCPICLNHPIYPTYPIYPCRSLCEKVKQGCEKHMKSYGYPWPTMFACDQFPVDNDMCVKSQSATEVTSEERCRICEQVNTVENILNNFCQSTFAIRVKLKKRDENQFTFKVVKIFKAKDESRKLFVNELLPLNLRDECCHEKLKPHNSYFVMGTHKDGNVNPTFIMLWVAKKSEPFKKSIRMLKTLDCSNVDAIKQKVIDPSSVMVENSSRKSLSSSPSPSPSPPPSPKTSSQPSNKSKRRGRKRGQNRKGTH